MEQGLKRKSALGFLWAGMEKFSSQAIQLIVGIFIARVVSPEEFGLVGMLAIFMALAEAFLDSGFANALIQKDNRTDVDYSTVFYFNVFMSLVLYGAFFCSAPFIADFYNMPLLTDVARVVSLSLIFNGLSIVQTAKLSIELNFKLQSFISISAVITSGICGIILAYNNFGVWALVCQQLMASLTRMVALWLCARWKPLLTFSTQSFHKLYSFGIKLLVSGLINTIYQNIYTVVIGKFFRASDVGFYNRGNMFAQLPSQTLTQLLLKVSFPVLSKMQNEDTKLLDAYRKLLRHPMFAFYPIMAGLIVLAKPMVIVLIGERWLPCVPILQFLCIGYIWSPLTHTNLNLLYVKGRSDLVLKLEIIKKPIAFLLLGITIPFGIYWMCIGRALYFFIAFTLNCHYTHKLLNYGCRKQLSEILPLLCYAGIAAIAAFASIMYVTTPWLQLLIGCITGTVTYIIIAIACQDESAKMAYHIIKKRSINTF